MADPINVLFLCNGNSARSILAEALTNHVALGARSLRGFSAGSRPAGRVHPYALDVLREHRIPTDGLRTKSWDEFAVPGAPTMRFVFTVCELAARDVCPVWPGHPVGAHWGLADPAAVTGSEEEKRRAFRDAFIVLKRRIELLACLPFGTLTSGAVHDRVRQIGQDHAASLAQRS